MFRKQHKKVVFFFFNLRLWFLWIWLIWFDLMEFWFCVCDYCRTLLKSLWRRSAAPPRSLTQGPLLAPLSRLSRRGGLRSLRSVTPLARPLSGIVSFRLISYTGSILAVFRFSNLYVLLSSYICYWCPLIEQVVWIARQYLYVWDCIWLDIWNPDITYGVWCFTWSDCWFGVCLRLYLNL